jgi:hypothetical protein
MEGNRPRDGRAPTPPQIGRPLSGDPSGQAHVQSMAIGTTLFAASIFEMPVHASADVFCFALCCQSPCLVRAVHFGGRCSNGFARRIANERVRAQLTLVNRSADEQFRLYEILEAESC